MSAVVFQTRRTAVLAFADEIVADAELLRDFAAAHAEAHDVSLVVYAPGADPAEAEPRVAAALAAAGIDDEASLDVLLLAVPGESDEVVAARVDAVLSRREPQGAFAALRRIDEHAPPPAEVEEDAVAALWRCRLRPERPVPALERWHRSYDDWIAARIEARKSLYPARREAGLFSILTTVWDTPAEYVRALATSLLRDQDWSDVEWILLDNGSTDPATLAAVDEIRSDPRARVFRVDDNLGIIGGLRYCLERATGRYVMTTDSDDLLHPDALRVMAWHVQAAGYPALLYSDEDKMDDEKRYAPYFKSGWDPALLGNDAYIAHLHALDRELALELDCYGDEGSEGSHDWDSFVRFAVAGHTPVHVPEMLYSWRVHVGSTAANPDQKAYVARSQKNVLQRLVAAQPDPSRFRVSVSSFARGHCVWRVRRHRVDPRPLLSVILTPPGRPGNPERLLVETDYPLHRADALEINAPLEALAALVAPEAEQGGLVHLVVAGLRMIDDEWPWEAIGLSELYPDLAVVAGRVTSSLGVIVSSGETFVPDDGCVCLDAGRPALTPGYFGYLERQRSVSAPSSLLLVADAAYLHEFLGRAAPAEATLPFLGAWLGASAARDGRRVVLSPYVHAEGTVDRARWDATVTRAERRRFVELNRDLLDDSRFLSPLVSRDGNYGVLNPRSEPWWLPGTRGR